jgi:hypothetical protein
MAALNMLAIPRACHSRWIYRQVMDALVAETERQHAADGSEQAGIEVRHERSYSGLDARFHPGKLAPVQDDRDPRWLPGTAGGPSSYSTMNWWSEAIRP